MAPSAHDAPTVALSNSSFPCTLTLHIPFPTPRLADIALRSIAVDEELSPLVRRSLTILDSSASHASADSDGPVTTDASQPSGVLEVVYRATTNRMLRVAVNGFFESLGVVLGVMRELDVDVVGGEWIGDGLGTAEQGEELRGLKKVQGVGEVGTL